MVEVVKICVEANVDGKALDVHQADIVLGINAIPQITLMVAPNSGQRANPFKPEVIRPSVSYFNSLYRDLAKSAQPLDKKCNIKITITTNKGNSDEIELKEWVLAEVGLSSVSATSAPYLAVTIKHPICRLTKVGSIYEEPRTDVDVAIQKATSGRRKFLSIVDAVYECVRNKVRFYKSPNSAIAEPFRMQLGVGEFNPAQYLRDDTSLFLAHTLQGAENKIAAATGRFVLPSEGGSSTWDMIVNSAENFMINVVQDEECNYLTNRLVLEPMKPWKSSSIVLDDTLCLSTDLPGMDTFKLVGVMARKFSVLAALNQGLYKNGNVDITNAVFDVLYAKPDNPKKATGRIMKTSAPKVLEQMFIEDSNSGGAIAKSKTDSSMQLALGFDDAIKAYCQAVYECSVGSMNTATARMVVGFRDINKKLITPGQTCKFTSSSETIYYGYIRNVVHHLNVEGGCETVVQMSYVRPDEKYTIDGQSVIVDGNVNAAYKSYNSGVPSSGQGYQFGDS